MKQHAPLRRCRRASWSLRNLPVFWRTLLMMLCIVLMALIVMTVSSEIFEQTLEENYLAQAQAGLERNCETMTTALYNTCAIPKAIEGTTYYNYIRTVTSGSLPVKYYSVLPYIGRALSNQMYLQGENEECILYLSGANSICTRYRNFPTAEDCFRDYIQFSVTDVETLFGILNDRNSVTLLPMQEVTIGNFGTYPCMGLAIRPANSSIAVLSLYSEETILEYFRMSDLPEGTYLYIEAADGTTLMAYPEQIRDDGLEESYALTAESSVLRCTVTLYLPKLYFVSQLRPARMVSWGLTAVTAVLGFLMAVMLSKASAQPIQALVSAHKSASDGTGSANEVTYLAGVLERSRRETENLQSMLLANMLSRVFSGAVLTEEEERRLEDFLGPFQYPCRLAIVHTVREGNQLLLGLLQEALPEEYRCQPINLAETGILFPGDEADLTRLEGCLDQLDAQRPHGMSRLICGISGPINDLKSLHVAVRQARLAMPHEAGSGVYTGSAIPKSSFSWLQHERLYQSVLAGDEDNATHLLQAIAMELYRGSAAREAYYNICFVLRSAADEMELPFQEAESMEYDGTLLPRQNIAGLESMVHLLFSRMREKQKQSQDGRWAQVLAYLNESYADGNLCAGSVAAHFDLSEKSVYSIVRSMTGMSFNEYLLSLRMRQAGTLLCSTRKSVGEIALSCGYQAESTFYRVFKKYYHLTPSQYRQGSMDDCEVC